MSRCYGAQPSIVYTAVHWGINTSPAIVAGRKICLVKNSYYGISIRLIMSFSFESLPLATFAVIIQSTSRDQFSMVLIGHNIHFPKS